MKAVAGEAGDGNDQPQATDFTDALFGIAGMTPSRNAYVTAIAAGFALAVPMCWLMWGFFPTVGGRYSLLILLPFGALAVTAITRFRSISVSNASHQVESFPDSDARHKPITKRSLRLASAITVFLIPGLMLCFLPLAMQGQLEKDLWPNVNVLLGLGFTVSIPLSLALFVASWLP